MPRKATSIDSGIDHRDQQAGAQVAQHEEQHDDHQEPALDQAASDGVDGLVDQLGAVVERLDADAELGQRRREVVDRRLGVAHDLARVRAHPHHDDARVTISPRPSRVTAPWRTIGASATSARWRT
jgi:hypothetical protein